MATFYPVTQQVKSYTDPRDGSPLNGTLRFGVANQDPEATEVEVFWDVAGLQPAPQPIHVRNGFAIRGRTPANVFAEGDFSAIARDTRGRLVYTVPNSTDVQLALAVTGLTTATFVGITDAGGYYTGTDVEAMGQEIGASLAVINAAILAAFPTGSKISFCGTVAPTGFVLESGRTIGATASNATERANADTANLYTLLWNSSTNTELPIEDSAGTPTTRGASAANDFAANKRLPLPDGRGRTDAGKDNMGGTTASRLTNAGAGIVGTTQFAAGGTQTHVLTTAQLAAHTHTQNSHNHTQDAHTHTQNSHNHTQDSHNHTQNSHTHVYVIDNASSAYGAGTGAARDVSGTTTNTGATTATNQATTATNQAATAVNQNATATNQATTAVNQNAGSDTAHQNTQPTIVYTHIIKL